MHDVVCAWQRYNLHGPSTERIEEARRYSLRMLNILCWLVNQVNKDSTLAPYVEFAFEWPR
eukprot:8164642-Heterocapsa_arctica.AAC.1